MLQRLLNFTLLGRGILPPLLVTFGLSIIIQNALLETFSADSRRLDAGGIETASIRLSDEARDRLVPAAHAASSAVAAPGRPAAPDRPDRSSGARSARPPTTTRRPAHGASTTGTLYALAMAMPLAIVAIAGLFLGIRTTFAPSSGPTG